VKPPVGLDSCYCPLELKSRFEANIPPPEAKNPDMPIGYARGSAYPEGAAG